MELRDKRVLVTGGNGFLGKHLVKLLLSKGADVMSPSSLYYNLYDRRYTNKLFNQFKPQVVIHAAAVCGGIGANKAEPGSFIYYNLLMGLNVIDAAREYGVEKFVQLGTVCSYPKYCPAPFQEENLWNGYPEETNAPYGIAKKTLMEVCKAYRTQYNLNAISLIPVNLYGPGDNFNLETSHVIPALIRKCIEAKKLGSDSITVWGTGSAYREFLYVEDCAEAIVKATQLYDEAEPINVGTGSEISMKDLVETIKYVTGYEGKVVYDPSKPDGQPRRRLSTYKAHEKFAFTASRDLLSGLRETVEWYENSHSNLVM